MIRHIVLWTLKETAHGRTRTENALEIRRLLEGLNGKIDGMRMLEVGIDISRTPASADIVLYSEFDSREALDAYQTDALHEAVKPYVAEARMTRMVADYRTDAG